MLSSLRTHRDTYHRTANVVRDVLEHVILPRKALVDEDV
jgi:hypothetical protein